MGGWSKYQMWPLNIFVAQDFLSLVSKCSTTKSRNLVYIRAFNPYHCAFADFYSYCIEQNCHVLVMTLYNLNLAWQVILLKENITYWKQTRGHFHERSYT